MWHTQQVADALTEGALPGLPGCVLTVLAWWFKDVTADAQASSGRRQRTDCVLAGEAVVAQAVVNLLQQLRGRLGAWEVPLEGVLDLRRRCLDRAGPGDRGPTPARSRQ